jgi:hypothetical protein
MAERGGQSASVRRGGARVSLSVAQGVGFALLLYCLRLLPRIEEERARPG